MGRKRNGHRLAYIESRPSEEDTLLRWECHCGATGRWVKVHPTRVDSPVVRERLTSAHWRHALRYFDPSAS